MPSYDFREGKTRILDILENPNDVIESDKLPSNDNGFTYNNAYRSWVTSLFVDIRDSTKLFTGSKATTVAKIARSFASEAIEILRDDGNIRDIGIRGDCVFAIYTTPQKADICEIFQKAEYIYSFLEMLNTLLKQKNYPTFLAGIGLATSKDLVVKAGRPNTGVNDLVWIGESAAFASKFSGMGNKNGLYTMVISACTYENIIEKLKKDNPDKPVESWFRSQLDDVLGRYYDANVVNVAFDEWVKNGMKD